MWKWKKGHIVRENLFTDDPSGMEDYGKLIVLEARAKPWSNLADREN